MPAKPRLCFARQQGDKSMGMFGWIVLAVVALVALYAVAVYNRLVRLRALAREGFSGITVQLRRRADLVPNLVSTVQGYATHERETLDQVIAHRTDAVSAKGVEATAQADNMMSAMLGRLMAVAEAYPDLKADENFRAASGRAERARRRAAGRAALLQCHRARPQHAGPARSPTCCSRGRSASARSLITRTRTRRSRPRRKSNSRSRREADAPGTALLWLAALLLPAAAQSRRAHPQLQQRRRRPARRLAAGRRDDHRPRRGHRDPPRHLSRLPDPLQRPARRAGAGRLRAAWRHQERATEPAATEFISNGVRIRIGSEDMFLTPGDYRYVIRYKTTRQLGASRIMTSSTGMSPATAGFPDRPGRSADHACPARSSSASGPSIPVRRVSTGQQAAWSSEKPGEIVFRTHGAAGPLRRT